MHIEQAVSIPKLAIVIFLASIASISGARAQTLYGRLREGLVAAFVLLSIALVPTASWASEGCAAINGGVLNGTATFSGTGNPTDTGTTETANTTAFSSDRATTLSFNSGDVVHFSLAVGSGLYGYLRYNHSGASYSPSYQNTASGSYSQTIPSGTTKVYVFSGRTDTANNGTVVASSTCTPIAPVVTSISPATGAAAGGTTVSITGISFTDATAVAFGGNAATSFTVNSDTQITATAPAGSGTVDVTVTSSGGTSAISSADQFTYSGAAAAPVVTQETGLFSGIDGGATIELDGSDLGSATVTVNGVAATISTNTATKIIFTTPANPIGSQPIVVTTPGGTVDQSAGWTVEYVAALALSATFTPSSVSVGGTTTLRFTLTKQNSYVYNSISFSTSLPSGVTIAASPNASSTVCTNVTLTAPAGGNTISVSGARLSGATGTACTFDVDVTNASAGDKTVTPGDAAAPTGTVGGSPIPGVAGSDAVLTVAAPAITSVSPGNGPAAGGTSVTITGSNFTGATAVDFGSSAATSFTIDSDTQITATAPVGSGAVDVTVTTPGGTSAIGSAARFTYLGVPTVTSISPDTGPTAGGTSVTITGTGFTGATALAFGGTAATGFTINSDTQITATAPAGTGTVDVKVTTGGGTSTTSAADQFTYLGVPTVTSISPDNGSTAGGTSVTITGTSFAAGSTVQFGGTSATSVTFNSATSLTATSPAGTGIVDVTVTTGGGTSATGASDRFTYTAAPAVTSISPGSGPAAGGTSVTITGSGFTSATAVDFGGSAATSFTVDSNTQITATAPAGSGTVDVTVTTTGGTSSAGAVDRFAYIAAPTVTSISPDTGPVTGGTSVTITGAGLTAATAVAFGGTAATSFTVNSDTRITATAPAGSGMVDVSVTTGGGTSTTSMADRFSYGLISTSVALGSSLNPSESGQSVTFTATVTGAGGTPTGNVTFKDGSTALATVALSGGVADFVTSALGVGSHSITAVYGGDATFSTGTSAALTQAVNIPADSLKLRALQNMVAPIVAQASGAAITDAVDAAIDDAFEGSGSPVTLGSDHVSFDFAAAPLMDTGGALGYADTPHAATVRPAEGALKAWADIRGTGWSGDSTSAKSDLTGKQVNVTAGVGYKVTPDWLAGVVGGYEHFNYEVGSLTGKMTGNGVTIGVYTAWRIAPTLRWDAALAWSNVAYDGSAGTASGSFTGRRQLASTGLTGRYARPAFVFEPSVKVYALRENESAYTDSLGTAQSTRTFSTGRVATGGKIILPWQTTAGSSVSPYIGSYADWRYSTDSVLQAGEPVGGLGHAWSGRVTGGVNVTQESGTALEVGAEYGGLGANFKTWTVSGRISLRF